MLHQDATKLAEEARRQRRALAVFTAAVLLLLGLCAAIGWRFVVPPSTLIAVGRVGDYVDGRPRRVSVPRLEVSRLITRREQSLSEDTIYIRRETDGSLVALLGVDTLSGCFLYWDERLGLFRDANCLGSRYTPDGRYLDGLQSGEAPQNMARLPVEVHDDQVFVRDEIARER
jgi:Rieske Fe-S protein